MDCEKCAIEKECLKMDIKARQVKTGEEKRVCIQMETILALRKMVSPWNIPDEALVP